MEKVDDSISSGSKFSRSVKSSQRIAKSAANPLDLAIQQERIAVYQDLTETPGLQRDMEEIYERIWELAQPLLNTRHNQQHTEIAYRAALRLLESEKGDETIVIPAIILHDVGWIKVPEELQLTAFGPKAQNKELNRVHEVEGVKLAREILEKVHYDLEKMEETLAIIDGHDSSPEAISPSDKIVKDADKLCRFTHQGTSLNCQRYEMSFDEWYEFLKARIDRWFFTQTAKRIAKEELERRRVEFAQTHHSNL